MSARIGVTVRDLAAEDTRWAAGLSAVRRAEYAAYSPVFWRPRPGVTGQHARFLQEQIGKADCAALRTDSAFIIARVRDREALVDDFTVDADRTWPRDGRELLTAALARLRPRGASAVRVVTAKADEPKVAMLVAAGLRLVDQWWVKPLAAAAGTRRRPGRVDGRGFSGVLAGAPPVYDPGGPVLLADHVAADADLGVVEGEAARMGAVLAVMPTEPGAGREDALHARGWTVASQWYLGRPH